MPGIKNILVATDFSAASQAAVEYGTDLASAFDATLHLLHVVTEPLHETWACYAPGQDFLKVVDELKGQALTGMRRLAPPATRGRATVVATWGDPSDEILKYARQHQIDLIVCGTHGRRGWELVAMGSVAARLIRLAPCAVLTVRGKMRAERAAA
jgi:universal stress protein A